MSRIVTELGRNFYLFHITPLYVITIMVTGILMTDADMLMGNADKKRQYIKL